jgi:hypothetical protein
MHCTLQCHVAATCYKNRPLAQNAERLLFAMPRESNEGVRRLPAASNPLFTPSVAITDMTAMLSLQVFSIFRTFQKSSRGNREIAHEFWQNFLRSEKRPLALIRWHWSKPMAKGE